MARMMLLSSVFISALLIVGCGSSEQENRSPEQESPESTSSINTKSYNPELAQVQEFVDEVVTESLLEEELADVAMQRSEVPEIDEHAKLIKLEHHSMINELKSLAVMKGWSIPEEITEKQEAIVQELSQQNIEEFEDKYLEMMVDFHRKAINKFERCADKNHDEQLTAWVNKMIPILQRHLDHSIALQEMTAYVETLDQK